MSVIAIPTPVSRRFPFWGALIGILVLAGGSFLGYRFFTGASTDAEFSGVYQPAQVIDLEVRYKKDGELQAVNNIDVVNRVEGISTVQELVKEGTFVHKGDKLVVLDSSSIQKAFDQSLLDLQAAESAVTQAREAKEIQEDINRANIQATEVELELAKLTLKEYIEGLAPAADEAARTKVKSLEIQLKDKEEALVTAQRLFAKGFVTVADVKREELSVLTVQDQLSQAETDLKVLVNFTYAKNIATHKSSVAQAEQKLERTRRENASNLSKLAAALTAQDQQLTLRKQLHVKLEEQLKNCTIFAPADGLVVFYSSMDRDRDPLKEGATVRNQQVLIRLPDTSTMKAVVRVPEGQVARLRVDDNNPMRAAVDVVGFKRPFGASVARISVLADSGSRWQNPDLKEYPVELLLDETPANSKPGMSAQVEIMMDRRPRVVAIPLTALYSLGSQTFVFVRNGANPKPVEVKVGAFNDTVAEIREGLAAGQDVLLLQPGQGRQLLEKAGIKTQQPTSRPGDRPGGRRRGNGGANPNQNQQQPPKRDEEAPKRERDADSGQKRQDSALPASPASQPTASVPAP